MMTASTALA